MALNPDDDSPSSPLLLDIPLGSSLCLAKPAAGHTLQKGDNGFDDYLAELYKAPEARALDQVLALKAMLRSAVHADDFWRLALTGIGEILQTQMVWISRRMKVEPENPNVELPAIGEDGAAFHCLAWYYSDDNGNSGFGRNLRSESKTSPSSYMKYNKPFLLPHGLKNFAPDYLYMNKMPIVCETYLGVPLFQDGECIGHFGCTYSPVGLANKALSWGFVQIIFHTFEDMFADRVIAETEPAQLLQASAATAPTPPEDTPQPSLLSTQGFKPYAKSLSHELRTPMHGIVASLELMQTSLVEATQSESPKTEVILKTLQKDVETTQDSCRRAVEAIDNVVQAYDLNMGLPLPAMLSTPASPVPEDYTTDRRSKRDPTKSRKRSKDLEVLRRRPRPQISNFEYSLSAYSERWEGLQRAVQDAEDLTAAHGKVSSRGREEAQQAWREKNRTPSPPRDSGCHEVELPALLKLVVNESLKVGGRPKSSESYDIDDGQDIGQDIEATFVHSNGVPMKKTIEWRVEESVPKLIRIHETKLTKIVSCVFQNALKFTREGRIYIHARQLDGLLNIMICDSGPGISPEFQQHLFEPFAREDLSITRGNEGLGLGLLVAKSLAHRLGGNLSLARSEKSGPRRGSDFEIIVPFEPVAAASSRRGSMAPGTVQGESSSMKRKASSAGCPETSSKTRKLSADGHSSSDAVTPMTPTSPRLRSRRGSLRPIVEGSEGSFTDPHSPSLLASSKQMLSLNTQVASTAVPYSRRSSLQTNDVRTTNRKLADDYPLRVLIAEDQPVNRLVLVKMLTKLGYDPKTQIVEAYDGADALRRVVGSRRNTPTTSTTQGNFGKAEEVGPIDLVLMDLWMPNMDGYEATERILSLYKTPMRPSQRRSITEPSSVAAAVALAGDLPAKLTAAEKVRRTSHQWDSQIGSPIEAVQNTCDLAEYDEVPPIIMAVTADTTEGAAERAMKAGMYGCMLKPFKLKELERLMIQSYERRTSLTSRREMGMFGNEVMTCG